MSKYHAVLFFGLAIYWCAPSCQATLPRVNSCYDALCVSLVEHSKVRDKTYQLSASGQRFLLVRLTDGGYLSFLLRPVASCSGSITSGQSVAKAAKVSAARISSRGCLAIPDAGRFFQVDFELVRPSGDASLQLQQIEPSVQISGIGNIKHTFGPVYESNTVWLKPRRNEP